MNFLNQFVYRPWGASLDGIPAKVDSPSLYSSRLCGCGASSKEHHTRTFYPVQSYLNGVGLGRRRYYTLREWSLMQAGMSGLSLAGLGQTTGQTIALSTPQIVGGVITTGIATSTAGAGAAAGTGTFLGLSAAAIPIVGAVVAGVTLGLMALFGRKGPKQKVATTSIVDKVEPLLQQNLQGYFSGPRTASSRAQALNNFDAGWQYIVDNCGIPEMGNPGQACINDRKAGACTWKASCSQQIDGVCVDYELDPAGQCWNWFVGYRDPIANDPNVKSDPLVDSQTGSLVDSLGNVFSGGGGGGGILLLAAAGLAIAALVGGDKGKAR